MTKCEERTRSSSLGRGKTYRARYWAYLLDNLQQAIDEIYDTCEKDENMLACKEILLILSNYSKEFNALIDWLKLSDKLDKTPPPNRPASLSWEVRKPAGLRHHHPRISPIPPPIPPLTTTTADISTQAGDAISTDPPKPTTCTVAVQTSQEKPIRPPVVRPSSSLSNRSTTSQKSQQVSSLAPNKVSRTTPSSKSTSTVPNKKSASTLNLPTSASSSVTTFTSSVKKTGGLNSGVSPTSTLRRTTTADKYKPVPLVKQTTSSLLKRWATTMGGDVKTPHGSTPSKMQCGGVSKLSESTSSLSSTASSCKSWADTVKGGSLKALSVVNNGESLAIDDKDRDDGGDWKLVTSHKIKAKSQSPFSVARSPSVPEILRSRGSSSTVPKKAALSLPKNHMESTLTRSLSSLQQQRQSTPSTNGQTNTSPHLQKSHSTLSASSYRNNRQNLVGRQPPRTSSGVRATSTVKSPLSTSASVNCSAANSTTTASKAKSTATRSATPASLSRNTTTAAYQGRTQESKRQGLSENVKGKTDSRGKPSNAKTKAEVKSEKASPTTAKKPQKESEMERSTDSKESNSAESSMVTSTESVAETAVRDVITEKDEECDTNAESEANVEVTKCLSVIIGSSDERSASDSASDLSPRSCDKITETDLDLDASYFNDKMAASLWINKQGLTWAEQMEFLDQLEQRIPGRATKVHEKLSSPRKGITEEMLKKQEERQAKAQEHREKLREERAQNYREIRRKVEEHKQAQEEESTRILQRAKEKQEKAASNREEQLRKKVQKAHDEKEKVQEIAFINTIEAQNKRFDIIEREKESDMRLQEKFKKFQRKLNEKAAREAAAEERRKAIEEERLAKMNVLVEKRADKDRKIQQQLIDKEKQRQAISKINELVREKVNAPGCTPYETKKMCSACNVLITSEVYLLSHLKSGKHQEAMLRDQESYDTLSEDIESYSLKYIIDAPIDEKQLAETDALKKHLRAIQKKRCKKLKQKITLKSKLWEKMRQDALAEAGKTQECKTKFDKQLRDIRRVLQNNANTKGLWSTDYCNIIERNLGDIERMISKSQPGDKTLATQIASQDCINTLVEVIKLAQRSTNHVSSVIPSKSLARAARIICYALENDQEVNSNMLQGNNILILVECLQHSVQLLVPEDNTAPPKATIGGCTLTSSVFLLLHTLWDRLSLINQVITLKGRVCDIISYIVSVGIIDKLMYYFTYIQKPKDCENPQVAEVLLFGLNFVASMVKVLNSVLDDDLLQFLNQKSNHIRSGSSSGQSASPPILNSRPTAADIQNAVTEPDNSFDCTQLLVTLRSTDAMGVVSLLYSTLLCQHKGDNPNQIPRQLSSNHICITLAACRLLNNFANTSIHIFQEVLGREGLSLQIRHITSYLLWYCSHYPEEKQLLHQVLLLVGYYTVNNSDNQNVIHTGGQPTVLQQLCKVPFDYFCDNKLRDILIPTLLSCCCFNEQNMLLLCEEISPLMLAAYLEEKINTSSTPESSPSSGSTASQTSLSSSTNKGIWSFSKRFPPNLWRPGIEFLHKQ